MAQVVLESAIFAQVGSADLEDRLSACGLQLEHFDAFFVSRQAAS